MHQLESFATGLTCAAWMVVIALTAVGLEYGLRFLKRRAHVSKELDFLLRWTSFLLVVLDCGLMLQFALAHFVEPLLGRLV